MHRHTQEAMGQALPRQASKFSPAVAANLLFVEVKSECEGTKTQSAAFRLYSHINALIVA